MSALETPEAMARRLAHEGAIFEADTQHVAAEIAIRADREAVKASLLAEAQSIRDRVRTRTRAGLETGDDLGGAHALTAFAANLEKAQAPSRTSTSSTPSPTYWCCGDSGINPAGEPCGCPVGERLHPRPPLVNVAELLGERKIAERWAERALAAEAALERENTLLRERDRAREQDLVQAVAAKARQRDQLQARIDAAEAEARLTMRQLGKDQWAKGAACAAANILRALGVQP